MDSVGEIVEENNRRFQANPFPVVRVPVKHTNLGIRSHAMDMSTMVELTSFSTLGKIQPFLVTISATAALVVDIHCHLTDKEVCGYLGGHWDINTHNLSILGAYPCRYAGKDKTAAAAVEAEISKAMEWKRMTLVGWYHSHPRSHASPSLRDVDAQLDYEIKMKGPSDNGYIPCVGLICSPYNTDVNAYESNFNIFWSMPPPENRPHEYPRPMLLSYSLTQEQYISQDALEEIKKCIEYYKFEGGIDFKSKFNGNITYLEKLKSSLASKLPGKNNKTNISYWDLIREMICPGFNDGSDSPFVNIKFPVITDPVMQATGVVPANVFVPSVTIKPENSLGSHQKTERTSPAKQQVSHHISTPEMIPTFRSGELTVSLKNTNSDYEYNLADFTKLAGHDSLKLRNDFPTVDSLTQTLKFPDFSKIASFTNNDLSKLSGFSLNDFTKAASSSAYVRNIANLFSPLGKGMADISESFKPPTSSPMQDFNSTANSGIEDFSIDRKKSNESMDTSNYSGTEDLSKSSSKPSDFGTMLDMSIKKPQHSADPGESLNLSFDRQ